MTTPADRAVAVVGLGAILPEAQDVASFWKNIQNQCYSITEVPADRWSAADYFDPDPLAPDKTYSKIGGWVRDFRFNWQKYRMPPRVAAAMDESQQWAVEIAAQALGDYGYPGRALDCERTAVIMGTAMGGEMHYLTHSRVFFPEYVRALRSIEEFNQLEPGLRRTILERWHRVISETFPPVTEDSMPGELANIISGRIANVFNLRGPNFVTDAACAASLAAVNTAVELLNRNQADAVLTGGADRNMGIAAFVKFCKIGALSATGSRPFGEGADGFVMGEGSAAFLCKRLSDAERDGDRIYAVIRGVGGSSDGRGKGIYAPNPAGQQLAIRRAWESAGLDPATAALVEAHGTSTRVGDVVEAESLSAVYGGAPRNSIALGSVKSNIGHLKAGAGAAGLLKAVLALYHKVLPPTLNATHPNPDIDFEKSPFYLNHSAREWEKSNGTPRRCGVSANGFGGTNFHVVLEEYIPGALRPVRQFTGASLASSPPVASNDSSGFQGGPMIRNSSSTPAAFIEYPSERPASAPLRGILALGASTPQELLARLEAKIEQVQSGWVLPVALPELKDLQAAERLVFDFGAPSELLERMNKALRALEHDTPQLWKSLQAQGVFRGSGPQPGKVAFLFTGQGSQYVNMGRQLIPESPEIAGAFQEADEVLAPILGRPLTEYIFFDSQDPQVLIQGEANLMQTEICQPAVLTLDIGLYRMLGRYGMQPDMVMGHSLGEYAALIASGAMPFADALTAAAARGREMANVRVEDNGWMAAVMAPFAAVEETLKEIDGYAVAANINSTSQAVVGGASQAVEKAIQAFQRKGFQAFRIPVSHAFHTQIVAPAAGPLRQVLDRLSISPPRLPMVTNVSGEFYPDEVEAIKDLLMKHIASPVQWMEGLETLYANGARLFVEVGPKKALKGFVDDVLGERQGTAALFTCHPKTGELASFNQALCGLFASGYTGSLGETHLPGGLIFEVQSSASSAAEAGQPPAAQPATVAANTGTASAFRPVREPLDPPQPPPILPIGAGSNGHQPAALETLANVLAGAFQQAFEQLPNLFPQPLPHSQPAPYDRNAPPSGSVVISGTGLGLPGAEKSVMDPENARRILRGEQFVNLIPERFRKRMVGKHIVRLVKSEDGSGSFESISDDDNVIKLAGRPGNFNLSEEYGISEKLVKALDTTTQLAMAAGLEALHEAGLPLVQTYRLATTGKYIPDRWMLPESLRDETGVIFASAFPGGDEFAREFSQYYAWQNRVDQVSMLEDLMCYLDDPDALREVKRRIDELRDQMEREPYVFDRNFLFRILAMGHSQFAELVGARGPNTQVNAACASTTQAIGLAEDWIRTGRCRRVLVVAGDNVTSDNLMEWVGAGFLALGAAAIDDRVEDAAIPFDRRRHGTILGMGACALVVESEDAVRERGMRGIVEVLNCESRNSAFHSSRLNVDHISAVMDQLVRTAEQRFGVNRLTMASQLVFVSHETYTPARGGSASAEVVALRTTFGEAADEVVIANTKGFTGHAMGVGVEDVIAVKILEYGIVPPVPNFKEEDPSLGRLNLSRGWRYPLQYALHLAAGFGSQIAMTLLRRIPGGADRIDQPLVYQHWLEDSSGYDRAETEVVKRTLRVKANGVPGRSPAPSAWKPGTGPAVHAAAFGNGYMRMDQPAHRRYEPSQPGPVSGVQPPVARIQPQAEVSVQPAPARTQPAEVQNQPSPAACDLPSFPVALQPPAITETPAPGVSPQPIAAAEPPAPQLDPVTGQVLEIVAEKTGYPIDMLDLDLDLEADLGIDTVKQAETFLAIREAFGFERPEGLKLREYPTLAHVIRFVYEMRPDLKNAWKAEAAPAAAAAASAHPIEAPTDPLPSPVVLQSPAVVEAPAPASDPVREKILEIVAEKTGYPIDMLDLDLDLEADLGIDTVKQAETFLAIREAFGFERPEGLKLREYPTLAHVIRFVYEMRPDLCRLPLSEGLEPAAVPPAAAPIAGNDPTPEALPGWRLEAADRFPRRVPVPALLPSLEFCRPTGVDLVKGSRVIVMADSQGVGAALAPQLIEHGVEVLCLEATTSQEALAAKVKAWMDGGPVQGVYWLPAMEVEPPLQEIELPDWHELTRQRVKNLYSIMRMLYASFDQAGVFLVAATRMGGLHGYGPEGATAPLGGAVAGFLKALSRERPQALVKVIDFSVDPDDPLNQADSFASLLIGETLADPGAVEIGYWQGRRYGLQLVEQPAEDGSPGVILGRDTVFLVTGAAGGITSAIITDLAAASGGRFYLLDLIPLPDPGDPQIALFRQDKEALKSWIIAKAKDGEEKLTPAKVEKRILGIERQAALLQAVQAVEAAGGQAAYYPVDMLDGEGVRAVVEEIQAREGGRIDVVIHAAGVDISRSLPEKDPNQFDLVFGVKADGLFNLLRAAAGVKIGALVAFSSVAGRFGNAGQVDYSAANDLLCKIVSSLRRWRPEPRGIAIDWTAWSGAGMATRGSIPKIMQTAGIEMLPLEVGVPTVRRELVRGGFRGEIVVAGQLGMLAEGRTAEAIDLIKASAWLVQRKPQLLMVGEIKAAGPTGLQVETRLDPQIQPFLYDHAMEGTPLLPGVMGIEAFAELAACLGELASDGLAKSGLAGRYAPLQITSVENVDFQRPFKFYRMQPQRLYLSGRGSPDIGGALIVRAELRSLTQPVRAELTAQERIHFSGQVHMGSPATPPPLNFNLPSDEWVDIPAARIYRIFFHGPAYQVLESVRLCKEKAIGKLAAGLPEDTQPAGAASLAAPRLIELCFQTAGVWEIQSKNVLALPVHLDAVHFYHLPGDPYPSLYALVEAVHDGERFNAQVVDESGAVYLALSGYRTIQLPGEARF